MVDYSKQGGGTYADPAPSTPAPQGGSGSTVSSSGIPDSEGNVHVTEDYSKQGGGTYDTVVAGFKGGYSGSGFQAKAENALGQTNVRQAIEANSALQASMNKEVELGRQSGYGTTTGEKFYLQASAQKRQDEINASMRQQQEVIVPQSTDKPKTDLNIAPAPFTIIKNDTTLEDQEQAGLKANLLRQGINPDKKGIGESAIVDPKYGVLIKHDHDNTHQYGEQAIFKELGASDSLFGEQGVSNFSKGIYDVGHGFAEQIRNVTSQERNKYNSFQTPLGTVAGEAFASAVDFISITPASGEVILKNINNPVLLAGAGIVGGGAIISGGIKQIKEDPIQFAANTVVFMGVTKGVGIAGKGVSSVAKKAGFTESGMTKFIKDESASSGGRIKYRSKEEIDTILSKPGDLTDAEYATINTYLEAPAIGRTVQPKIPRIIEESMPLTDMMTRAHPILKKMGVEINPNQISIIEVAKTESGAVGYTKSAGANKQVIEIQSGLSKTDIPEIVFHEIFHAVSKEGSLFKNIKENLNSPAIDMSIKAEASAMKGSKLAIELYNKEYGTNIKHTSSESFFTPEHIGGAKLAESKQFNIEDVRPSFRTDMPKYTKSAYAKDTLKNTYRKEPVTPEEQYGNVPTFGDDIQRKKRKLNPPQLIQITKTETEVKPDVEVLDLTNWKPEVAIEKNYYKGKTKFDIEQEKIKNKEISEEQLKQQQRIEKITGKQYKSLSGIELKNAYDQLNNQNTLVVTENSQISGNKYKTIAVAIAIPKTKTKTSLDFDTTYKTMAITINDSKLIPGTKNITKEDNKIIPVIIPRIIPRISTTEIQKPKEQNLLKEPPREKEKQKSQRDPWGDAPPPYEPPFKKILKKKFPGNDTPENDPLELSTKEHKPSLNKPRKKGRSNPLYPSSYENITMEEFGLKGKRAGHIQGRKTSQELFENLRRTGRGIPTESQFKAKNPKSIRL